MFSDALQQCLTLRFSATFFFFYLILGQSWFFAFPKMVVSHCLKWEWDLELAQPLCHGESANQGVWGRLKLDVQGCQNCIVKRG